MIRLCFMFFARQLSWLHTRFGHPVKNIRKKNEIKKIIHAFQVFNWFNSPQQRMGSERVGCLAQGHFDMVQYTVDAHNSSCLTCEYCGMA